MLTSADLKLPDAKLAAKIRQRVEGLEKDPDAKEQLRELAFLFELDTQIRNGGFAQYFFNSSVANAFDAWFASDLVDALVNELLSAAVHRLGVEFGQDLDLHKLLDAGGDALGQAYEKIILISNRVRASSTDIVDAFVKFSALMAPDRDGEPGFEALNAQYFKEVDLDAAVVAFVRAEPDAFVTARR